MAITSLNKAEAVVVRLGKEIKWLEQQVISKDTPEKLIPWVQNKLDAKKVTLATIAENIQALTVQVPAAAEEYIPADPVPVT
jgi:hypothetical protein